MTGTDRIREKIIAANKRLQLARFMQDVGCTQSALEHFLAGRSVPPPDVLCRMAVYFWPNAKFDPINDVLVAGNAETKPKPLCAPGWAQRAKPDPHWRRRTADDLIGFRAVKSALPPAEKPKKREGWLLFR